MPNKPWRKRRAGTDVAVFDGGARRLHAEHDDPVVLRRFARRRAHLGEGERIGHDMIGGKRDDERIVAAPERISRARDNGRTGIPPHRLEQNVGFRTNRRELLGDQEAVLGVGDDDRPTEQGRIGHAANGFLERR